MTSNKGIGPTKLRCLLSSVCVLGVASAATKITTSNGDDESYSDED